MYFLEWDKALHLGTYHVAKSTTQHTNMYIYIIFGHAHAFGIRVSNYIPIFVDFIVS